MSTAGGLDDATVKIEAQKLRGLVTAIFAAIGCSTREAERIGTYLVGANLAGHDSHGVARVPR
ncbi:MAG TPA: Ldh family oxidoreductase, partial [Xanthobacteraceae bacterium]|nr:Ldh family oxidoreductase [Xanthobacteraceae bacterium]